MALGLEIFVGVVATMYAVLPDDWQKEIKEKTIKRLLSAGVAPIKKLISEHGKKKATEEVRLILQTLIADGDPDPKKFRRLLETVAKKGADESAVEVVRDAIENISKHKAAGGKKVSAAGGPKDRSLARMAKQYRKKKTTPSGEGKKRKKKTSAMVFTKKVRKKASGGKKRVKKK